LRKSTSLNGPAHPSRSPPACASASGAGSPGTPQRRLYADVEQLLIEGYHRMSGRELRRLHREAERQSPFLFVSERGSPMTVSNFQKLIPCSRFMPIGPLGRSADAPASDTDSE
jgi:hypothetical protein